MSPLNLFRSWRERGLEGIDAAGYAAAWQRYGGSVMTHPGVVATLSGIADIPVRYLARRSAEGEIVGALDAMGVSAHDAKPMKVVKRVYADIDKKLWPAAKMSVKTQLEYLREV